MARGDADPDAARATRRALLAAAATNALVLGTDFTGTAAGRIFLDRPGLPRRAPTLSIRRRTAARIPRQRTVPLMDVRHTRLPPAERGRRGRGRDSTISTQRVIGRLPAPAPGMEPRPPTTAPTTAVPTTAVPTTAVPATAVPTAAVPTGRLHGGRGDRRRLGRSGRGDRCGTDSDRGSARRHHRCDALQSDSHNGTSFRWPICPAFPGLRCIGPITSPQTPKGLLRLAGSQSVNHRRPPQ
jgi:hypothetical protein